LLWDPSILQSNGYWHIFSRRCRRIFFVHLHFCNGNNSNEIFRVSVIHDSGDSDCVVRKGVLGWGHQRLEVCGPYLKNFYFQQGDRAFNRNGGRSYCYTHDYSMSWLRRLRKYDASLSEQILDTRWMEENEGLCVMWQLNG
jgi:hypothetical protein